MKIITYSSSDLRVDKEKSAIFGATILSEGATVDGRFSFDAAFLAELQAFLSHFETGAKANFGHQDNDSAEGVLAGAGRIRNARLAGNRIIGDLYFYDAARQSPLFTRDPVDAALAFAAEDPTSFGLSLNMGMTQDEDGHYHPARVTSIDLVGVPAGTPNGLLALKTFSDKEIVIMAKAPEPKTENVKLADAPPTPPAPPADKPPADKPAEPTEREKVVTELLAFQAAFPDAGFVLEMFLAGKTLAEAGTEWKTRQEALAAKDAAAHLAALEAEKTQLAADLAALKTKQAETEAKLAAKDRAAQPAQLTAPHAGDPKAEAKTRFDGDAKLRADFNNDLNSFLAYEEAEKAGRISITGAKK